MSEQLLRYTLEIYNPDDHSLVKTEQYKNLKDLSKQHNLIYHVVRVILDDKHLKKRNIQTYTTEITKKYKIITNPINI
jgi:hypothetical protein